MPWDGEWDELPAAHGAAIFFDLATIVGLFLVGRRLRRAPPDASEEERTAARLEGNGLGVILAFAWCAYPYTTYALQSNSNDSLVAALIVWAFVAFASPAGRGVLLGLASMAKFAPIVLAPLFAVGERGLVDRFRRDGEGFGLGSIVVFSVAFLGAIGLVLLPTIIDPGLSAFYDRTLENQLDRESPFSVWGQEPSLDWLQTVVRFGALALALALAFVPRRRSLTQVAALAAAVLIASQLGIDHWFYLYLPWFFALAVVGCSIRPSPPRLADSRRSRKPLWAFSRPSRVRIPPPPLRAGFGLPKRFLPVGWHGDLPIEQLLPVTTPSRSTFIRRVPWVTGSPSKA